MFNGHADDTVLVFITKLEQDADIFKYTLLWLRMKPLNMRLLSVNGCILQWYLGRVLQIFMHGQACNITQSSGISVSITEANRRALDETPQLCKSSFNIDRNPVNCYFCHIIDHKQSQYRKKQDAQNLSALRFTVKGFNSKSVQNLVECDVDILIDRDAYTLCAAKQRLYLRNKSYVLGRASDKESNPSQPTEPIQESAHLKVYDDLPPGTGKRAQVNFVLPVNVDSDVVLVEPVLENYFPNVKHCYVARSTSHVSCVNGNKAVPLDIVNTSQAAVNVLSGTKFVTVQVLETENILPCDEIITVTTTELNNPKNVSVSVMLEVFHIVSLIKLEAIMR
ncbi:hypothetical protein PR048_013176 [Dryococelus australis]|uniref:Uncharacterized protein n=1 Tax=Dryococelus australis TaxID=614101 RepID=A0ABQ9HRI5_9NEOP|nr:hypothetical protein PR048_013176 [Dryococelus australis]